MKRIKIAVTGTGSLIGQAVIKSVKNSPMAERIELIGMDYFKDTIGSFWADKNYILPDILKKKVKKSDWLKKIIRVIKSNNIKALFIGVDFELRPFSLYKKVIESKTGCKVVVSSPEAIRIADDKYLTYKFLKENGFYHPETFLPGDVLKKRLKFPYFVKPRSGSRSRDVFTVSNKKELDRVLALVKDPIIQELIGRPDNEYTCGIIYLDNEVKGAIAVRRDLKDGNTAVAYFKKDIPRIIYDYVYAVSKRLKPFGACNFQLRLDAGGRPKIFEINARHSGTTYIRSLFGFNEVEYIISYLFNSKARPFKLKEGIVRRYYDELFISS